MESTDILKKMKKMSWGRISKKISSSLRAYMFKSKRKTAVIGISGGADSAVTAALCTMAVGKKNVFGIVLPSPATAKRDMEDAKTVIKKLGIRSITIDLSSALCDLEKKLEKHGKLTNIERGNLAARLRMAVLYSFAHSKNGLVIGTGDKSELLLGYFTKYGDGGCDILPIGRLYKTQVREIGKHLGLPKNIFEKPSSPGFWRGHAAEKELGASYEQIDTVLWCIEKGWKKSDIEKLAGPSVMKLVLSAMAGSTHKRKMPNIIEI